MRECQTSEQHLSIAPAPAHTRTPPHPPHLHRIRLGLLRGARGALPQVLHVGQRAQQLVAQVLRLAAGGRRWGLGAGGERRVCAEGACLEPLHPAAATHHPTTSTAPSSSRRQAPLGTRPAPAWPPLASAPAAAPPAAPPPAAPAAARRPPPPPARLPLPCRRPPGRRRRSGTHGQRPPSCRFHASRLLPLAPARWAGSGECGRRAWSGERPEPRASASEDLVSPLPAAPRLAGIRQPGARRPAGRGWSPP